MTTRRELEKRKAALQQEFRQGCRTGAFAPGETLPPVTQLAQQYQLSVAVVRQALQPLMAEGILYTIPRVGTFVGPPLGAAPEFYVLAVSRRPCPGEYMAQIQIGFEDTVARLGGASHVIETARDQGAVCRGDLPNLAGLFDLSHDVDWGASWTQRPEIALVRLASTGPKEPLCDIISFDDVEGGRQATRHLLSYGHRQIAFMGLHPKQGEPVLFAWSMERALGWQLEMHEACCATEGILFQPASEPADQRTAAREIARDLLRRPELTAVITANDATALGLFAALEEAQLPAERWPAVVSFDDELNRAGYLVTSLRLPWGEVGVTAAELLWERRHGRLSGPRTHRRVPMRLIARLTSRANWPLMVGEEALAALEG